jgi:hypothetical protein
MVAAALEFPLGRPYVPAATLRRLRTFPPGATALVSVGAQVRADQPIAELAGAGGAPLPVLAGMAGAVVGVAVGHGVAIEGTAAVLQGVVGIGGQVAGPLAMLARGESLAVVPIPRGAIILFPQQVPLMLLQRAAAAGAVGVVAPCASVRELEAFARADLSVLLDGLPTTAPPSPLSVLLTEGLGSAAMARSTYQLLAERLGDTVLLSGATEPRRNIRPEVLLSLPAGVAAAPIPLDCRLTEGARVAVATGPGRGARGEVLHVFARQQFTGPGVLAPAANIRLEDGSQVTLPLHALDRVE